MIEVEANTEIARPVDEVFTFMTDLGTLPQWLEGVREARALTGDPNAVGGRVAHVNEFMGQTFESTFETLEWQPCRSTVFKVLTGPLRGESHQRFEELSKNRTRVSIFVTGDGSGLLKLGNFIAKRAAKRQMERSLANAKRLLEDRVAPRT